MATGPTFAPSDAFPASYGDALEAVLGDDLEIRKLMARKTVNLLRAQRELGRPDLFENRMLAKRSFRAQVAALLQITEKAAENLIGYSNVLCDAFSRTMDALASGQITWQHATAIADELGSLPKTTRERIEEHVLAEAVNLTPNQLRRMARSAREIAMPESIPEKHAEARQLRGVGIDDGRDGMSTLFLTASSAHVHAIFNRLTVGAKGIDGPLEQRTLDQRRADLLTHLLLAEVDGAAFGVVPDEWDDENFVKWFRGIKAEVAITVPVLTLLSESEEPATLDGWVPIDPETAQVLAAGASSFIRILTHPETGAILSVGRDRYEVPKDLRRVLEIRDRNCRFPGCELAAWRTDIDHTREWQFGGETRLINLGCLCRGHHTLKTAALWAVTQDHHAVMTWTDCTGRSYITKPHNPMAA